MALKVGELYASLGLKDKEFNKGMKDSEVAFAGFGKKLVKTAFWAAGAIGAALTLKEVTDNFLEFERKMNEVFTLIPDASQKAMDDMTQDVKDFSKEFGTLPNETIPALYQSLSAGVPKNNVFEFLETAQMAAKGGVTELSAAVDGISSVVNAYGDIDPSKVSDLMFTAVKGGKTTFDELSSSLYNVIPTASALGVQFGDVTSGLAAMTAQGTPTSVATTQMRQMLVELSKEGSGASDTFKELAGKSFKDFISEGGNVQDALKIMEKAAKDNNLGINDLFGSVEAGNAALSLTGKGTQKFSDELKNAQDSAGATEQAFDRMEKGVGPNLEKIRARAVVAGQDIAEKFEPMAVAATQGIIEAMDSLPELFEEVKAFLSPLTDAFRESAGVLMDSFYPIWQSLKQTFEEAKPLLEALGIVIAGALVGAIAILNGAFRAIGPIIQAVVDLFRVVVNVIMAIISIFTGDWTAATEYWNQATEAAIQFFVDIWEALKEFFIGFWDFLTNLFPEQTDAISKGVKEAWEWIKKTSVQVWNSIKSFFSSIWNGIKSVFTWYIEVYKKIIFGAWNLIKNTTTSVWNGIKSFFSGVWDTLLKGVEKFKNAFVSVWDGIKAGVRAVVNPIIGMINALISGVEFMVNAVARSINKMPSFKIPSWVPVVGGESFGLPSIPKIDLPRIPSLDVGTDFVTRDGLAMIHKGEQIVPADTTGPYQGSRPQPAFITLVLGRREFGTFVEDITRVQERNQYVLEKFRG